MGSSRVVPASLRQPHNPPFSRVRVQVKSSTRHFVSVHPSSTSSSNADANAINRRMRRRRGVVPPTHPLFALLPTVLNFVEGLFPLSRYSVARLQDYQQYATSTKLWRIVLVMLLMPVPSFGQAILLNFCPMVAPDKGINANWAMLVRTYLSSIISMVAMRWQRKFFLQFKSTSLLSNAILANTQALLQTGTYAALPHVFGRFPVPFMPLVALGISMPAAIGVMLMIVRRNQHQQKRTSAQEQIAISKYKRLVIFELALYFIYSLFSIGFEQLVDFPIAQTMYACLLPLVKFALTIVAKHIVVHMEDLAAETVVFSVEFFNSMYSSMFMGIARVWWTSAVLMTIDFVQMIYHLIRLNVKAKMIAAMHIHMRTVSCSSIDQEESDVIVSSLRFAYAFKEQLESGHCGIRFEPSNGLHFTPRWPCYGIGFRRVAPSVAQDLPHFGRISQLEKSLRTQLLREVLDILCAMERIVLTEYVEAFVPFFYSLYIVATYYSPNKNFFYGILDMNDDRLRGSLRNMMLYGLLEWLSLLVFFALMRWRFGMNVLTLLGFVLETHFANIQGKMLLFMTMILSFSLVHYGMDFTFKFEYGTKT